MLPSQVTSSIWHIEGSPVSLPEKQSSNPLWRLFQTLGSSLTSPPENYIDYFERNTPLLQEQADEITAALCPERYPADKGRLENLHRLIDSHGEASEGAVDMTLTKQERDTHRLKSMRFQLEIQALHSTTTDTARVRNGRLKLKPLKVDKRESNRVIELQSIPERTPAISRYQDAELAIPPYVSSQPSRSFAIIDELFIESALHNHKDKHSFMSDIRKAKLHSSLPDFLRWFAKVDRRCCVYWLWQSGDDGCDDLPHLLADRLDAQKALTSAFFFPSGTHQLTPDVVKKGFAATLATEATHHCPPLRQLIARTCEEFPHITSRRIDTQIEELFIKPYKLFLSSSSPRPLFVIINGLDRCPAVTGTLILTKIVECTRHLPICFLIASRKVDWVVKQFGALKMIEFSHQQSQDSYDSMAANDFSPTSAMDSSPTSTTASSPTSTTTSRDASPASTSGPSPMSSSDISLTSTTNSLQTCASDSSPMSADDLARMSAEYEEFKAFEREQCVCM